MKKLLLLAFTGLSSILSAQTYSAGGGSIPDGGPVIAYPLTVSGLSPSTIDTIYGVETVCLDITHTWDADLNISLQAPDGTIVDLSMGNGWDQDNYTNTCFNGFSSTSIVSGWPPFTGVFRPQGFLGAVNNGQNGNGTWKLLIQDTYPADAGVLTGWSITFGSTPAKPFNFSSSDLPIVSINTFGANIPDEPKIQAFMGIIYNGPGVRNYLTDPFNNYRNNIGIELRGSSSMSFPQKAYGFETRDVAGLVMDTVLLGMPSEHDWILYAPYDDKTCMRNVLSYDIANKTGHYASRTKFCELVINGQYKGIYILMEKVKRDNNRVDISKLTAADTTGDALTGGYIVKIDKITGSAGAGGWYSSFPSITGSSVYFQYSYPSQSDLMLPQSNYIKTHIDTFETVLNSSYFAHPTLGYRKFIDVGSFIDYFILNEISKNVDGYRLSSYMYKEKDSQGGKLFAGPAWDYNLGWWNANYCEGDVSTGWAYEFGAVCPGDGFQLPFWWDKFLQDPTYTAQLKCRWTDLRSNTLSNATLNNWIDSVALYLNESQDRHFQAWPILGVWTWPNPGPLPTTYAGEIAALKSWIQNRMIWLDANMPGICNVGIAGNQISESDLKVYPNPFNNSLSLQINLQAASAVQLELFDVFGKLVKKVDKEEMSEGAHLIEITFDGQDLAKGMYLLKLSTHGGSIVTKVSKAE
jgi:subtilisin-like proprotein convertase family protein